MRTPHTSTYQGKRVLVVMKDGTRFVDKFIGKKSTKVEFDNHLIDRGSIKSFTIYKPHPAFKSQTKLYRLR